MMVRETEERVDREVGRERGVGVMHLPLYVYMDLAVALFFTELKPVFGSKI